MCVAPMTIYWSNVVKQAIHIHNLHWSHKHTYTNLSQSRKRILIIIRRRRRHRQTDRQIDRWTWTPRKFLLRHKKLPSRKCDAHSDNVVSRDKINVYQIKYREHFSPKRLLQMSLSVKRNAHFLISCHRSWMPKFRGMTMQNFKFSYSRSRSSQPKFL